MQEHQGGVVCCRAKENLPQRPSADPFPVYVPPPRALFLKLAGCTHGLGAGERCGQPPALLQLPVLPKQLKDPRLPSPSRSGCQGGCTATGAHPGHGSPRGEVPLLVL